MVEMGSFSTKKATMALMKKTQYCVLMSVSLCTGIWPGLCVASVVSVMSDILLLFEEYGAYVFTEMTKGHRACKIKMYTRIRGEWYNLQSFEHPGGPVAISLALGRDATALFESHHYFIDHNRLYRILSKYKVNKEIADTLSTMDPRDDGSFFDWEAYDNSPFTKEMKTMVRDHFKSRAKQLGITLRQATKATPTRWALILSLMFLFFATIPSFVSGEYWTLITTPFLAWVVIANYWHDSLHFSLSCDWRVNAVLPYLFPWLSSPWVWYHQHVIGHHAYTNIEHRDPDLAHAPQLQRHHKSIRWRPRHKNQHKCSRMLLIWSIAVGGGLQILSDVRANLKGTYNNVVPYHTLKGARLVSHIFGRWVYVVTIFVWPFWYLHPLKAVIWAICPIMIFSWFFMLNSQINHLTETTAHAKSTNFLKHQVMTAQNFGVGNRGFWGRWCRFFSGGLNYQIEHHLFPTINHCHLPALQPKVKAICRKHGVAYNEVNGYIEALRNYFIHAEKLGHKE